uniref:Uncharacterized protein n=1 Tax=Anguilla anguilla TaxID=7936 RepID=A0A0E9X0R8_ANGAN
MEMGLDRGNWWTVQIDSALQLFVCFAQFVIVQFVIVCYLYQLW